MSVQGGIPGLGLLSPDQHQLAAPTPSATQDGAPRAPATVDPTPAIRTENAQDEQEPAADAAPQVADHASSVQNLGQQLEESSLRHAESVQQEPPAASPETTREEPEHPVEDNSVARKEDHDGDTAMAEGTDPSTSAGGARSDAPIVSGDDNMLERKPKVMDPEFLEAAEANKNNPNAEWQYDSSDADSDDSDTSSDTSSEDESDEDEYPLLDPAEQARILMQEEYGDDDGGKGTGAVLRTANEIVEEKIEKPDVTVTTEMKITELGNVESIVDNMILIKANTSGEYQVLESGSVLCTENRAVIGAVTDTLGRVQEPLYTVAFNSTEEISEAGLSKGTTVYYVNGHSTYVFTEPLRNLKGTDASNQFDEEVGENEIEFSDDEAEAEYKRQLKQKKRAAHEEKNGPRGGGKANHQQAYTGALSYDDDGTDMYTPMKRPDNLHHMMSPAGAPVEEQPGSYKPRGGRGKRGGRGERGGRGGRGGAVPQRSSGYQQNQKNTPQPQAQPQQSYPAFVPPPPQVNPNYPQAASLPFQFNNPQAHAWPQSPSTAFTFGVNQPTTQAASNIPAGSFVNPAFFQGQQQQQQQQYGGQAPYQAPQQGSFQPQWNPQQAADAWRMIQAMAAAQTNGNNGQGQSQSAGQNQQSGANSAPTVQEILRNLSNQNNNGSGHS